ncbi:EamA family transporter [Leptolyngbya sp. FACHB-711]|uniref:DMT family transporter n=1 Tax=unclassified Leptolyngbya TaxID=2650499 RepID=UPI00168563B0|nr:EamA family transporter [Leptolyngbya sp. FACHB-711]MBD1848752.1 EamA family transporter [Cyanobacteria bacterium FACHB-502]MBD2023314.1 EamA family transporter [Leptolyngbya sp. FACHB-711]
MAFAKRHLAFFALVALAIVWGYNWVVMKIALQDASPFDFAALRAFFGAMSLFLVLRVQGKSLKPEVLPETIVFGLLQTTGVIGLIHWALVGGGAGKIAVLNYTMPFWALLFAWIFLKERLHGKQWLSVGFALAGLLLVLLPLSFTSDLFSKGLGILSGICWATSAIFLKRLTQRRSIDLVSFTAWQMLIGSLPLILIALTVSDRPVQWTGSFMAALLYNIIPGSAVAWLLWFYALRQLPTGAASLGTLAVPVVGVFAARTQLGEIPSMSESIGIVLILLALLLNAVPGRSFKAASKA